MVFNATLVEIARPGPLAPNGDPGEPQAVWEGRARGYLKRTRRQAVSQGVAVIVKTDTFTLLASEGAPVIEQAGPDWSAYTVVLADERTPIPSKLRFTVRGMENRAAGTRADSIRLELEAESNP